MNKILGIVFLLIISLGFAQEKPKEFVYLYDVDPSIKMELRYITSNNFIGRPIDGYLRSVIIVTKPTAIALKKVQKELKEKGFSLKIFDAYRPQQAVDHFVRWAKVLKDTIKKSEFYPDVPKSQLFNLGYIASKSGHSRGSTVDLTMADLKTGKELDMGSPFDFFGTESHPFYKGIDKNQIKNRMMLRNAMLKHGFKPYENEWWHFTLRDEPFPKTYFNFPVK
ncbi:MAG: peptidase M15 [Flavobacteriaceae bacterium]|nr:peptidase M15 [Flavobacteriaceae bacterium]|tara:strand:+ start:21939 stop:22607 length:669 start_codon:yes stop_codon:yes gene_type:complete